MKNYHYLEHFHSEHICNTQVEVYIGYLFFTLVCFLILVKFYRKPVFRKHSKYCKA